MTKQLIALAIAAAFGIAHAADTKPATETKPAAVKVAEAKDEAPKATGMQKEDGTKLHKKAHKRAHKKSAAQGETAKAEPATPATPATPAEPAKK